MTQQILVDTGAVLSQAFYADEAPIVADGVVTVTVTRTDGTQESTGPATLVDGAYTYSLAAQPVLGLLTLTWAGTFAGVAQSLISTVEVVGGFYVALSEVRPLLNLDDQVEFTTAELMDARRWFESKFEDYVGMAFVPRAATERISGRGTSTLMLNHWPVRSVTAVRVYTSPTVYTAFTASELADISIDPSGAIRRYTLGYWAADVEVDYVHGQAAPPADVKDAAKWAIRDKLLKDNTGDHGNRQRGVATDGVFVGNITGPFFNDEVNAVADAYRAMYRVPSVA